MNDIKCKLGFHKYEVIREENVTNTAGDFVMGKVYVQQCKHCGKLKHYIILTVGSLL